MEESTTGHAESWLVSLGSEVKDYNPPFHKGIRKRDICQKTFKPRTTDLLVLAELIDGCIKQSAPVPMTEMYKHLWENIAVGNQYLSIS